jgi:hypothetical protein
MVDDPADQAESKTAVADAWQGSEYHHDAHYDDPGTGIVQLAERMHGPRLDKLCHNIEAGVSDLLLHILPPGVQRRRGFVQLMAEKPWRRKRE